MSPFARSSRRRGKKSPSSVFVVAKTILLIRIECTIQRRCYIETRDVVWGEWKRVDPKSTHVLQRPELLVDRWGSTDKEAPRPVAPSGVGLLPDSSDYGREQSKPGEQPVNADTSKSTDDAEAKARKLARVEKA
jgi:hypothetical protein